MYQTCLYIGLTILIIVFIIELWKPEIINEGFSNLISVGESSLWTKWMPKRGDIGMNPTEEQGGYIRDMRYFAGYTDVQRIGVDHDFCRMVQLRNDPKDQFFACALGGSEGLSTVKYRTPSVKNGFEISRDDYMNDVLKEGRSGYCRILKIGDGFEAKCNPAGDSSFLSTVITDSNPPDHIRLLLTFYENIVFWLRFRDDMVDYANNITVSKAGNIHVDEFPPNPPITEGAVFNGIDQFLRIGDTKDLSFGDVVQLRYLRGISFWIYFEEFTNNAHIFDFGNGAGKDNVFAGIIGRGNIEAALDTNIVPETSTTVPCSPSGQQCTQEISPERAMLTSSSNVDIWDCPHPELFGRIMKPLQPLAVPSYDAKTADLLYEIWDAKQRKLHIQVKNIIPLKKWVHITITTTSNDPAKPGLKIYQNGQVVHTEEAAWLPQNNYTTNNYIGKSNWTNGLSPYENDDELFKGKIFDFRGYKTAMSDKKVKDTYKWGKIMIGQENDRARK